MPEGLELDGLSFSQLVALARINEKAALFESLPEFASYAVTEIAAAVGCDYCGVLLKQPETNEGQLTTAGAYGLPESLRLIERPANPDTLEGFTLFSEEPVVIADIASETRFRPPAVLIRLGMTGGVTVPLAGPGGVLGVLEAYRKSGNRLTPAEIVFLNASSQVVAAFVDRREVDEGLRRRTAEQAVLVEIGRVLASSLQISAVYERFADLVQSLIPFDRISLSLVDESRGVSRTAYSSGLDFGFGDTTVDHDFGGRITGEVVSTRRPLLIHRENAEYHASRLPKVRRYLEKGLISTLSVPLVWRDEVVGVLTLRSLRDDAYDQYHAATATRIATLIAGTVANNRLYDEVHRLARERLLLAEIGRSVNSAPDIRAGLSLLAKTVGGLMPVDRMTVGIIEPDGTSMRRRFVTGLPIGGWEEGTFIAPSSPAGTSVQSRSCRSMDTAEEVVGDSNLGEVLRRYRDEGIRSVLYMPLFFKDKLQGLAAFSSRKQKAYGERELSLADRIAPQVSGFAAAIRAEEQLERANRRWKAVAELRDAAEDFKSVAEVFQRAGRVAASVLNFDLLVVASAQQQSRSLNAVFTAGLSSRLIDDGKPFALAGPDGQLEVASDVASLLASAGLSESAVEPVRSDGSIVGLLTAYTLGAGGFPDEDLQALREIAGCAGVLVARLTSDDGEKGLVSASSPRGNARQLPVTGKPVFSDLSGWTGQTVRAVVVDSDAAYRRSVRAMLSGMQVNVVGECGAIGEVPDASDAGCDVVVWCLHAREGSEVLKEAARTALSCKTLVLAERLSVDGLRNAFRSGVSGYVSRETSPGELQRCVVTVAGGGTVVEPALLSVFVSQLQAGGVGVTAADAATLDDLSERDLTMLTLLARGKSNKEIALDLNLATGSVKNNLMRLYRRIGASDRVEATAFALRTGLLK